jgi:DNA repair exonuclease SbcCD ATPase subunit
MSDENKPSQMLRVPTPLIDAVRELSRLHRQGKTSEVLAGLDDLIFTLDDGSASSQNGVYQTISEICDTRFESLRDRLDNLESQLSGSSNSNEVPSTKRIYDLEQKIDSINNRLTQFAEAIMQLQSNINNQPKRGKSYYSNSYNQGQPVKFQPITEESLASRLGVTPESLRKERENQPAPLFFAWSKRKDTSGIGWEFNEKTNLYHPVT